MIDLSNSGGKSGLRDWVLQRFSALYIAFYSIFLFIYFFINDVYIYNNIVHLFSFFYFKLFTVVFIFSVALHASLGLGIVITDYIKNAFLRILIDFFVNIVLLFYIFFIMQILWGFK